MKPRDLVFAALSIALLAVSALITIPFGPVPFTLQTAVILVILLVGTPKQALISIGGYIVIGAFGVPVFSGGQGGVGVLVGPTGGFLYGFFLGMVAVWGIHVLGEKKDKKKRIPPLASDVVSCVVFLAIMYLCGWLQLMFVTGLSPVQALLVGVAPFIILDSIKAAFAIGLARPLRKSLKQNAF